MKTYRSCTFLFVRRIVVGSFLVLLLLEATVSYGNSRVDRLRRHVETLTSKEFGGRLSGTPYEKKAAQYIKEVMKEAGLKPGVPGYLQCFQMITGAHASKSSLTIVGPDGKRYELQMKKDYKVLPISSDGVFEGLDIVFAGYGITAEELKYDDYAHLDVKGKVVLILEHEPEENNPHSAWDGTSLTYYSDLAYKAMNAREHGAKAVLFLYDRVRHKKSSFSFEDLRFGGGIQSSGIPVLYLSPEKFSQLFPDDQKRVDTWVDAVDEGKEVKHPTLHLQAFLNLTMEREEAEACNVVGMIPGTDPEKKDKIIVLGAHFDHLGYGTIGTMGKKNKGKLHPGADDNASGTAVLLELARTLAKKGGLGHTVYVVAFTGEERGILGSMHFVRHPPFDLKKVVAMFNMDMVGRLREELVVFGTETAQEWKTLLKHTKTPMKITSLAEGYGPSDHTSFFLNDIPVLHVFTGSHLDHHQPTDTPDKLNYKGMDTIISWLVDVLEATDTHKTLTFQKPSGRHGTPQMATSPRFRVRLGTMPDYTYSGKGVRLNGVRKDSPAEKAGLKKGDTIIQVGQRKIQNVYDYTYALSELKPGEKVKIVVLRENKKVELTIIPEPLKKKE